MVLAGVGGLAVAAGQAAWATLRFETARPDAPGGLDVSSADPSSIGLLGLTALLRPNLLLRAEAAVGSAPEQHFGFRFATLNLGAAL